jgi:hypothetical protein
MALQGKPTSNWLVFVGLEIDVSKKLLTGWPLAIYGDIDKHVRVYHIKNGLSVPCGVSERPPGLG